MYIDKNEVMDLTNPLVLLRYIGGRLHMDGCDHRYTETCVLDEGRSCSIYDLGFGDIASLAL